MCFETEYKNLINSIKGHKRTKTNNLSYNVQSKKWTFEAVSDSVCPLGEVSGEIITDADSLDELMEKIKMEIRIYNSDS